MNDSDWALAVEALRTEPGELPELGLDLTADELARLFAHIKETATLREHTAWDLVEERDRPISEYENLALSVARGKVSCVCLSAEIAEDIEVGVFIFPDGVVFHYLSGHQWNVANAKVLFEWLYSCVSLVEKPLRFDTPLRPPRNLERAWTAYLKTKGAPE